MMHISVRHCVFYGELAKIFKVNKKGGWNKRGGWQTQQLEISLKYNHQTILWNYQQKEHKKYRGSLSTWKITCSFAQFSSSQYVVLHCNQKSILYDVEEQFMLPRKTLNIIVFCKAQHNA